QADRLGVAVVQVAVGLGRKARLDAPGPFCRAKVPVDDVADAVGGDGRASGRGFGGGGFFGFHRMCGSGVNGPGGPAAGCRVCTRSAPAARMWWPARLESAY